MSVLLVVHLSQRAISLLSRSVPDLKFNYVVFQLDIFGQEAAANRGLMVSAELAAVVPIADAGLSDTHVAKQHNLVVHHWFVPIHFHI